MTKFRGCIDIHSGQVKQIVGGTLTKDDVAPSEETKENFVSTKPSSFYADLYRQSQLHGCHVIKLGTNKANDEAAKEACLAWPDHLQVGGGITIENAKSWIHDNKASHVIVTSYLFPKNEAGEYYFDKLRLEKLSQEIGPDRLVVDLSCRRVIENGAISWYVATNKWQSITKAKLSLELLAELSQYCCEFLIHAADVEGLCKGIDTELVENLGKWCPSGLEGKITYAGGAKLTEDLDQVKKLSDNKVDLTFGSALDIFGGKLVKYEDLIRWNEQN